MRRWQAACGRADGAGLSGPGSVQAGQRHPQPCGGDELIRALAARCSRDSARRICSRAPAAKSSRSCYGTVPPRMPSRARNACATRSPSSASCRRPLAATTASVGLVLLLPGKPISTPCSRPRTRLFHRQGTRRQRIEAVAPDECGGRGTLGRDALGLRLPRRSSTNASNCIARASRRCTRPTAPSATSRSCCACAMPRRGATAAGAIHSGRERFGLGKRIDAHVLDRTCAGSSATPRRRRGSECAASIFRRVGR